MLLLISLAFAEDAWLTEASELHRWPGATEDNPVVKKVNASAKVEVIYTDGELTRVRSGVDFGWVPSTVLTSEAPEAMPAAGGLLDGLDFGGIKPPGALPGAPGGMPPMKLPPPPSSE